MEVLIFLIIISILFSVYSFNQRLKLMQNSISNRDNNLQKRVDLLEKTIAQLKNLSQPIGIHAAETKPPMDSASSNLAEKSKLQVSQISSSVPLTKIETPVFEISNIPVQTRPTKLETALQKIWNYFTTENTIVKVGVVLIFFGIGIGIMFFH